MEAEMMRRAILIMTALGCLSACTEEETNKNPEYWLEQYAAGRDEWDRVARVFGFFDDYEGCQTIVKALAKTMPRAQYRCERAD
jgi:hypothetical protein